jgi:hypothetical protein
MTVADQVAASPESARAALAAEWESKAPRTPAAVLSFYKHSEHLGADLDEFHADPTRQHWTAALVHIARNDVHAKLAVDIGSGGGHDLRALRAEVPDLIAVGIEPNDRLRASIEADGIACYPHVTAARDVIAEADIISCFDVLEHVVDPETFLGEIAGLAKLNAVLLETCATFDTATPLHLKENRGWRTGRVLERNGWEKIADDGRLNVWQRMATQNRVSTSLIVCAYRSVSMPTYRSILRLLTKDRENKRGWREAYGGEAGINRARSIRASMWWANSADDVFLMVDDDIIFEPEMAERLVDLCRDGHDVIAAAYPVRDGGHLAVRTLDGDTEIAFGPGNPPKEMRHVSTGFFAVHRRVLDAMIPTLPLCHGNQSWAFWPLFDFRVVEDEGAGGFNYLSEDYNFCEMARSLGFKVWLDTQTKLKHLGLLEVSVQNMDAIAEAIKHA